MTIHSRPFGGDDDAHLLADVVTAVATDRRCNYWHVGCVLTTGHAIARLTLCYLAR